MNANNVRMNNKLFIFKEYRSPGGISDGKTVRSILKWFVWFAKGYDFIIAYDALKVTTGFMAKSKMKARYVLRMNLK